MQPPFESWSLSSPGLSARTAVYALEPLGIGTPTTESLTSYIVRLAEAHSVTVGDFIGRLLSEIPNPMGTLLTQAAVKFRAGSHGFHACGYAINGNTERSAKWVCALETATGRSDLRHLTLLSLSSALPQQMFRRCRAWCPACLEHWRSMGLVVYEPLAWTCELSCCCAVHKFYLRTTCHRCRSQFGPLGAFSRIGYCPRCGGWLGQDIGDVEPAGESIAGQQQLWASEQIGQLLAMLPHFAAETACGYFRGNLAVYLKEVVGGNVAALAEYIHSPRSILQNWLDGRAMPRLESLLRIARALNVSAAGFFFRKAPIASDVATAKQSVAALGDRGVSPSRTASEIGKVLRRAVKMEVPISLSEVARTLGYKTTERLYQADRKVCHRIAARYRQSGRSHWWRRPGATRICEGPKLKQILEEAAKSNEPVSVHQIAARLGYSNDGYIGQKYPELCAAIGRKIAERKQASLGEMRRTLERSLEENPAPTLAELSLRLGCSTSTTLRTHEPELCDRILARYRTCIEERRCALRTAAELSLNEAPAPSLRSVRERLGISAWFMNNYFPDVQRRIVERHRRWKTAETVRRRERLVDIVHGIAKEVQSQGLYPSATRIADRIPQGYRCEWMTLNAAVRQAQRALGISITAS